MKFSALRCGSHCFSYTLTFMLLASEMAAFGVFVVPLPFKVRRRLFRFLSESVLVAKIAYGLKISFMYELSLVYYNGFNVRKLEPSESYS
jgi:hypothetical protein